MKSINNKEELNSYLSSVEYSLECVLKEISEAKTEIGQELKSEIMNGYIDVYLIHETLTLEDFNEDETYKQIEFIINEENLPIVEKTFRDTLDEVDDDIDGESAELFYELIRKNITNKKNF